MKSVILQTELREEMKDHIKVRNISPTAKIDVIEEYIQILDEGQMKTHTLSDLSKRR